MAKYAEHLFRHKLRFAALLLIPIALGVSVAVVFAGYRATATLKIEDPSAFGATFQPVGWSPSQTPAQNLAESMSQVVKTPAFSDNLSGMLATSGAADPKQIVASVRTNLKVNASSSHSVTLTYTCSRAALCQSVLSNAIDSVHEQLAQIQQDQAAAAKGFWSSQLKDAQANLAAAQSALKRYAAANPGATMDASSNDPQVVQLVNTVQLWKAKVLEAQNSLSQAEYLETASVRFLQVGTTVVDPPHVTGSGFVGDGTSLLPGAAVLVVGMAIVGAYFVLLTWADRTAADAKALERSLGVPVVAQIPKLVSSRGV